MAPIIAIDLCNTVADIRTPMEQELGPCPNPQEYYHPKATPEFFRGNLWIFENAKVLPGAVEGVNRLAKTCRIVYLTARPKEARQISIEWLTRHGFPRGQVITTNRKHLWARRLGVSCAIDDAPYELKRLSQVTSVVAYAQPYNQDWRPRMDWQTKGGFLWLKYHSHESPNGLNARHGGTPSMCLDTGSRVAFRL